MDLTKVCKGTDIVVAVTMNGNNIHTFGDIKWLTLVLHDAPQECHKHIPTTTATNQCCDFRTPISSIELKSLVTSSDNKQVIVGALFPANMQTVGGVYNVQVVWAEKTDDLIADNKVFNYAIDTDSYVEVVSKINDSTIQNNRMNIVYNFKSKSGVEDPTL